MSMYWCLVDRGKQCDSGVKSVNGACHPRAGVMNSAPLQSGI